MQPVEVKRFSSYASGQFASLAAWFLNSCRIDRSIRLAEYLLGFKADIEQWSCLLPVFRHGSSQCAVAVILIVSHTHRPGSWYNCGLVCVLRRIVRCCQIIVPLNHGPYKSAILLDCVMMQRELRLRDEDKFNVSLQLQRIYFFQELEANAE